jgi:hypothetical protein
MESFGSNYDLFNAVEFTFPQGPPKAAMAVDMTHHFQGTSSKENGMLQQAAQKTKTRPGVIETINSELESLCALMKLDELLPNNREAEGCKDKSGNPEFMLLLHKTRTIRLRRRLAPEGWQRRSLASVDILPQLQYNLVCWGGSSCCICAEMTKSLLSPAWNHSLNHFAAM